MPEATLAAAVAEAEGVDLRDSKGAAGDPVLNAVSEGFGMLKRGEIPASISSRESALQFPRQIRCQCNATSRE